MKITFLGTSGANAYPEAFCNCNNCEKARSLGGYSLRKRSSVLVNDDLLIDIGPDIMPSSQMHAIPLTNVQHCIQTHPHADHLDVSHFISRSPILGVKNAPRLHFYASEETLQRAAETFLRDIWDQDLLSPELQESLNLSTHTLQAYSPTPVGLYTVTAFPANHAPGMGARTYAIESNGSRVFYGTDTGVFFEETWQAFRDLNMKFDLVVLDHSFGLTNSGTFHMNAKEVIEHFARFKQEGLLNPGARTFATHIAHDANPVHPELVSFASHYGYEIAYDGLTLEI